MVEQGHGIVGGGKNSDQVWMPKYRNGNYIWAPPPAAADVYIDELHKARHKRQESTHLFVCERIMAPSWRWQMHRSADVILSIPPGHPAWPRDMHEPLTIAIIFLFLKAIHGNLRAVEDFWTWRGTCRECSQIPGHREMSFARTMEFHEEASEAAKGIGVTIVTKHR